MRSAIFLDLEGFWRCSWGRFLFLVHFLLGLALVGYAANHFGEGAYLLNGDRGLFLLIDWPQYASLEVLGLESFRMPHWQPSRLNDALETFVISLPWWGYGYIAETAGRFIHRGYILSPGPVCGATGVMRCTACRLALIQILLFLGVALIWGT